MKDTKREYGISCDSRHDGKGINIWRDSGHEMRKIARFLDEEAAAMFIKDFNWPISDAVKKRIKSK